MLLNRTVASGQSSLKRAPSERAQYATVTWLLKRTTPCSATLDFSLRTRVFFFENGLCVEWLVTIYVECIYVVVGDYIC